MLEISQSQIAFVLLTTLVRSLQGMAIHLVQSMYFLGKLGSYFTLVDVRKRWLNFSVSKDAGQFSKTPARSTRRP